MNGASSLRAAFASLLILLAGCPCASALNPSLDVSQYAHTAWKNRDGFLTGTVNAIAQTPDGYLWIGTEFGLFRFDGVRTVAWQASAHQPGRGVRHLLAARDGTLWIAGAPGLASWKDGRLTEYPPFADLFFTNVVEDREGRIWVGQQYPPSTRICVVDRGDAHCGDAATEGSSIASLFEDAKGSLWPRWTVASSAGNRNRAVSSLFRHSRTAIRGSSRRTARCSCRWPKGWHASSTAKQS